MYRSHVLVCGGTGCTSSHSAEIIAEFEKGDRRKRSRRRNQGHQDRLLRSVRPGSDSRCLSRRRVLQPDKGRGRSEIVDEHLIKGRIVKHLLYDDTVAGDTVKSLNETQFYKKQKSVALRNCGVIDPENINEYIAMDGYQALAKCLTEYTPDEVIQIVKDSGLRGRGGGGFPTGLKWSFTRKNQADQKYVVCNADEGDPGAFMDRSVLEGDPHCIVEAMAICGYATGATEGYIYVRAEYPSGQETSNSH